MARFVCVCGEQIRTSGDVPNPMEWHILSDVDFDRFHGQIDAEEIYRATTIAYRCPVSGHLYIYWEGFDQPPFVYEPLPERGPA